MKKLLLLSLTFVVFLFAGCSKKEDNKIVNKNNSKVVIEEKLEGSKNAEEISIDKPIIKIKETESKQVAENILKKEEVSEEIRLLRKKHEEFLNNSPFKKTKNLSKKERKALGIPPNKYYEQEWELSIDPATGRPLTENLAELKKRLKNERDQALLNGRTPGDGTDNNWVERGPDNVGGRVRAVMFDPNDATFETVYAGGVSGGLWKNTNISNSNSVWARVNIPDNLAVSSITVDPNNSNIFYVGTGESYVSGDVNGNGVWKTTDGGVSWMNIFGGITGPTTFEVATVITVNSPVSVAGNYTCYPTTAFGPAITTPITSHIVLVSDGTALPTEGCNALTNGASVNGKIALIRRGTCPFVQKIINAQNAGAIAVIMMNNVPGTPTPMGGTDSTIMIPSVMISKEDGDALVAALGSGNVNSTLNPTSPGGFTGLLVPGQQHINDIKVRNNGGVSEIYVAAGDTFYSSANQATYLGGPGYGLYKSVNGGTSWTEISLPLTSGGNKYSPNDIEIAADNKIWLSTTRSTLYRDGGGVIFSSTDGVSFTQAHTIVDGRRTQIAVSKTSPNKVYVLAELGNTNAVGLYSTSNGFSTVSTLGLPADADSGVGADFTRGQAFYDLMLEVDPNNDQVVYTGGIDLFKSTNGGTSWSQFSHWYGGFGYQEVHADQHGMAFAPGSSTKMLFGNDGGVYFSNNSGTTTSARNKGLNITQFYSVGVSPTAAVSGLPGNEYFAAGAQDNGTQYFANAVAGINSSVESQGGDGAFTMFDQGADKYYISNYVYNESINLQPLPTSSVSAKVIDNDNNANNGAFIAPMVLDSNLDLLYSDYTSAAGVFQIRRYGNLKGGGNATRTTFSNVLLRSAPTAFAVSPYTTTATVLLVGTRLGKLYKIPTANTYTGNSATTGTWFEITGPSFVGSISDVEFGASENEIFVTMHNYNVVNIWYTKDGGATWLNKEGNFPDIPVKAILPNPLKNSGGFATEVIIGTDLGVWYSNNFDTATPSWSQSYNGMSNVKVTDLDMRNDNMVYAATYGRGVFSGMFTSTTLSSLDFSQSSNVKMYPNPANDLVNISISNYVGDLKVDLFDINGRLVKTKSIDFSGNYSLDLNGLTTGVYIVKLSGSDLNYSEKIVIN
jgi:photosystem II stability/assembly factor-like uncharacterized protein